MEGTDGLRNQEVMSLCVILVCVLSRCLFVIPKLESVRQSCIVYVEFVKEITIFPESCDYL